MSSFDRDEQPTHRGGGQWPQLRIGSHRPLEHLPPTKIRAGRPTPRGRGHSDWIVPAVGWVLPVITVLSGLALLLGLGVLAISWEAKEGLPENVVAAGWSSTLLGGSVFAALLVAQLMDWRWSREISTRIQRGG